MNEEWNDDENMRNLYHQIAGNLNYAAQLQRNGRKMAKM